YIYVYVYGLVSEPDFFAGGEDKVGNGETVPSPTLSVREAWRRMVERVPVSNRETKTPGELARIAVREGFPSKPVEELTSVFREVEYGEKPSTERRKRKASESWERIRRSLGESLEENTDSAPTTDD
ncbi:MAG: DUF4129 domain-containing protein, partial [Halobacteria archaeon]|nr:DUF4129 domain-containing protein [Halobacteria archaeon]